LLAAAESGLSGAHIIHVCCNAADGEVGNVTPIEREVKAAAHHTRVFTFGIGSAVSHHLVKALAKAGNGEAEFIVSNQDVSQLCLVRLCLLLPLSTRVCV
jgi:hypothetical protein